MMAGITLIAALAGDPGSLTDPTKPVDYLPASALAQPLPDELVDWRLTAVRIGKEDRSAVLNGKVVRAGDAVGRARVLEIKPGIVVVDFDRKRLEIRMFGAEFKKPTTRKPDLPVQQ
jgi:hypothetical protein